jgi:hypothetical protein
MVEQAANPPEQRSAAFCPDCKRRRVQDLVMLVPVMDHTMREDQLMAAAFCGPELKWKCPCGKRIHANLEVVGW